MFLRVLILAGVALQGRAFMGSVLLEKNGGNCTEEQFKCLTNDLCIEKEKRCDGTYDCKDLTDEKDCEFFLCKEPLFFRCSNGRCIGHFFVCDGENDCQDFSDEENCTDWKMKIAANHSCAENEWKCSDNLCILKDWVCNGQSDCLDGSDESIGCTPTLSCDGFKCKNNHCVPNEWRCDGSNDCIDNSDEENCENYIKPSDCTWENRKFLCSNNHTCIDIHHACDGEFHCPDRSDESILCKDPGSLCSKQNCSHNCLQLPTGPKCYCPEGYKTINEKECQDINECEIYGICDQKCKNTPGSYECLCDHKYILQEDKTTCKAVGGEGLMVFSTKTQIRAYFLQSRIYFLISANLKQAVGVAYDGTHVYWTDIHSEHESIVKSLEDGSEQELLITAGLGSPEDLAIDTLTGNIYFTDAEYKHIGVCTSDGRHCTVLINKDIRKPRGIALNIEDGEMYWTDWGNPAEIAKSKMDGTSDRAFVYDDIHWPNGITVDYPNQRLYWTDAKAMTLESIRLDGTDRRIVLESVVKHPYSIAVFENRLYWSDWHSHTIQTCDKFTGKNHQTLIKDRKEYIYGLQIYHSSQQAVRDNLCALAFCSDICLLSGSSYSCACPQNKILSSDQHTCKDIEKRQVLILAADNILIHIEHQLLGRHTISPLPLVVKNVGAVAYNPINDTLYLSDLEIDKIIQLEMLTGISEPLEISEIGRITTMDFDFIGNNLYWGDEEKRTIEALNINTMARRIIIHDMHDDVPESIALVPEAGVMFVSFKKRNSPVSHLDRFLMDGTGRTHIMDQGVIGPLDLYFDRDLHRLFFADAGTGNIETTSIDGDDRHQFTTLNTNPVSIAGLKKDLFWVNEHSKKLCWSNKFNSTASKKIVLDIPENLSNLHLISVTSANYINTHNACAENNGNCSHLCIPVAKSFICACPNNMKLASDNQQCVEKKYCHRTEFKCQKSNQCVKQTERCDGTPQCTFGEDEEDCKVVSHCPENNFVCNDGQCIEDHKLCDKFYDCKDRSDEHECTYNKGTVKCPPMHFECSDGTCIADKFKCDGHSDCFDESDERNCDGSTCNSFQFRCDSGACIPKSWECDHEHDCYDLSDEHPDCPSTCSPDSFTCSNGKCIDKLFVCDNTDDCGDNSDEMSCKVNVQGCKPDEFKCNANSSICLPMSGVCNGTSECPGKEDEWRCSNCQVDEFMCLNKKCIPLLWLCDHVDDCGDGSDEKRNNCRKDKTEGSSAKMDVPCTGFRCKYGHCIDQSLVCNGQQDCYDGSDEGGLCQSSCDEGEHPCAHICMKTPTGPTCKCREGYDLKGDGKTCVDIDECKMEPPICSQLCIDYTGNYQCDCYDGFELRSDKMSCKARGNPMSMYFISNNQIRQLSQKENMLKLVYSKETARITGLAHSLKTNEVFVAFENTGTLLRINEKTGSEDVISNVGQPKKLAMDWINRNLYFFNTVPYSRSIDVCNFDTKYCAPLIKVDLRSQISNLVIDSVNRFIFYTTTTWLMFNAPKYAIYRTYLDGTGSQAIMGDTPGYVIGLTFDVNKKQLYYVDQHRGEIKRVNYDGTKKHTVLQNVTHPMGLGFFENHVYYLSSDGLMYKRKLYDSNVEETFRLDTYSGGLFTISQESLQPTGVDSCANHNCSYLCLPSRVEFSCLCEDGRLLHGKEECHSNMRSSELGSRYKIRSEDLEEPSSGSSSVVLLSVFIVVGILLVAAMGAYYLKRRKYTGGMNIGISFHNDTYGLGKDEIAKSTILTAGQHEYTNPIDFDPTELQTAAAAVSQKIKPLIEI